jgi:hypothetical protein
LGDLKTAFTAVDYTTQLTDIQSFVAGDPESPFAQSTGSAITQNLDGILLQPGYLYKINVTGTTQFIRPYTGNLSADAVPEPATWAMMLAGFGLVGFAMRRRRQSHPTVRFAF